MEVRITTLIENIPDNQGKLYYEHGLSLWIEADGKHILFDTGQSGDFTKNLKELHKKEEDLDYIVMSHGHYDHSGGFKTLMEHLEKKPPVFVGSEFFQPKYKSLSKDVYKYIGNGFDETFFKTNKIPLHKVETSLEYLTETILLFHHFKRHTDFEKRNPKFYIKKEDSYIPDDFCDEVTLGITTKKGLVLIVGCSHIGVVNIVKSISDCVSIPVYALIGGTHLVDADEVRIQKTVDFFKEKKIQLVAVSHCTGEEGILKIQKELKDNFVLNNTGNVIEI